MTDTRMQPRLPALTAALRDTLREWYPAGDET